jgi:hypothetical protein
MTRDIDGDNESIFEFEFSSDVRLRSIVKRDASVWTIEVPDEHLRDVCDSVLALARELLDMREDLIDIREEELEPDEQPRERRAKDAERSRRG